MATDVGEAPEWLRAQWSEEDAEVASLDPDTDISLDDEMARRLDLSPSVRVSEALVGPLELQFLPGLLDIDPRELTDAGQVDQLVLLERMKARVEAEQLRVLAAMDARDTSEEHFLLEEVRLALRLSRGAAAIRVANARTLKTYLPGICALLQAGTISVRHADVMCDAVRRLAGPGPGADAADPPPGPAQLAAAAQLEAAVAARIAEQTPAELARAARRVVLRIDPDGGALRHAAALSERRVYTRPEDDGIASLTFTGAATDVAAVYGRIDAASRLLPAEDPRSRDQQRADVFIDAVLSGLPLGGLPTAQGRAPGIEVRVGLATLLGLDDEPGELGGYGPIPAGLARDLAGDPTGTWRRLLTDPATGAAVHVDRRGYRPPAALADLVAARDVVCVFPGCAMPARRCQLDHIQPYHHSDPPAGGATSEANLAPLCGRHHDAKTKRRLHYLRHGDGHYTWHTRTGHTYTTRPPTDWAEPPVPVGAGRAAPDHPADDPSPAGNDPPPF